MIIDFRLFPPVAEYMDPAEAGQFFPKGYLRRYLDKYGDVSAIIDTSVEDMIASMKASTPTRNSGRW